VGQLTALSRLSVAYNKPGMVLPPELGLCKNITWLDISGNKYEELPEIILKFVTLQVLEANSNALTVLPKEFGLLNLLRELRISHNQLKELPEEVGNFAQLQELEIAFNNLEDLPKSLGTSPAFIQAHSNPFSKLPPSIVEDGSGAIKHYLKQL